MKEMDRKNRYKISMLVLWVGTKCTLKCRDCCNLIPYIDQESFEIDNIINDVINLSKICDIRYLQIQGGELFTHPEVEKIIKAIDKIDIPRIWITSNGTINLKDNILDALKKVKHPDFKISLSQYEEISEKQVRFYEILKENNIRCDKYNFYEGDGLWVSCHTEQKESDDIKAQQVFEDCTFDYCRTLVDGKLYHCGRAYGSQEYFGIKYTEHECLDIRKIMEETDDALEINNIVRDFLRNKRFKEYCRYCLGTKNVKKVPGGIQIK
ncbi:radical SAM protein [Anaeromicropila herbilytica]|uniref:Radical SAM core domain-containing protein n=1 Tax=Anaeromicropila herbilytica TaxID=2785025 RepID=A0A7R7EPV1_9FIRM|nr:radical SAM protein [Anaeromicropila herbilytica]BCN32525.1 hypothetical protein bsdtb5_38200 [Anaeromicropila herbilytica]